MLIFESLSAGGVAILLVLIAVLILVSLYVDLVWPLTMWDLVSVDAEKYRFWWQGALWLVFAGGCAAGFWYFSGAAFQERPGARRAKPPQPPTQRTAAQRSSAVFAKNRPGQRQTRL